MTIRFLQNIPLKATKSIDEARNEVPKSSKNLLLKEGKTYEDVDVVDGVFVVFTAENGKDLYIRGKDLHALGLTLVNGDSLDNIEEVKHTSGYMYIVQQEKKIL